MKLRQGVLAAWAFAMMPVLLVPGAVGAQSNTSKTTQATAQAQSKALAAANTGDKIDLNSATADALKGLPGIGDAYAQRIIKGRPYGNKGQLTSRGVLPQATYDKIKAKVVASKPK